MGDYRAYILDVDGHRFVWAEEFSTDHPSDAAAVNAAKQLTRQHEVEVWEGRRLVACLRHGEEMSPGLAPSLPSICERDRSVGKAEPVSLSKVTELASAGRSENNVFLQCEEESRHRG